jgi:hypothetical protein
MPVSTPKFIGFEPKCGECLTEAITEDVSRCLGNCSKCRYGLPAGYTSTYCLHPDHKAFRSSAYIDSSSDRRKAAT